MSVKSRAVNIEIERDPEAADVRPLLEEYAASLSFDLAFQDFASELSTLPGEYAPPEGALLLARVDGEPGGCVALRRIDGSTGELKRLFVRPSCRGLGLGRLLATEAIELARSRGYSALRLDTTPEMAAARALYRSLGFREIAAYRSNPVQGASFLELDL
jgi:ribosomal protein S18 acetylase RimI-like enzyme